MPQFEGGLDLLSADTTSVEEIAEFRISSERTYGYLLPGFDFWLQNRPGVLKRHLLLAKMGDSDEGREHPLPGVLAALHYYAIIGYAEGVRYQIQHSRRYGATRGHILDTLSIAFLHASSRGMNPIAVSASESIAAWVESSEPNINPFPANWKFDPAAFESGLDFSMPEMAPGEIELLETWHLRHGAEVPRYVKFLGAWRPNLLKAHRNRLEHAIAFELPKQMLPYLQLSYNYMHGNRDGIRDSVLLARSFGVTRESVLDCICRPFSLAGAASLSLVEDAVGDILRSW
jgi:hypothetical protein